MMAGKLNSGYPLHGPIHHNANWVCDRGYKREEVLAGETPALKLAKPY